MAELKVLTPCGSRRSQSVAPMCADRGRGASGRRRAGARLRGAASAGQTAGGLVGVAGGLAPRCARATSLSRPSCARPTARAPRLPPGPPVAAELRRAGLRRAHRARSSRRPTMVRAAADRADLAAAGAPGRRHGVGASPASIRRCLPRTTRSPRPRPLGGRHGGPRPGRRRQSGPSARCCAPRRPSSGGPRACGEREVVLAAPRSFCAGVERAIEIVERALEPPRRPGLRAPPDRPQHPRRAATWRPRAPCSSRSSTRCRPGSTVVLAAHGVLRPRSAGQADAAAT